MYGLKFPPNSKFAPKAVHMLKPTVAPSNVTECNIIPVSFQINSKHFSNKLALFLPLRESIKKYPTETFQWSFNATTIKSNAFVACQGSSVSLLVCIPKSTSP